MREEKEEEEERKGKQDGPSIPTQRRMRSSGRLRSARTFGSIEACLSCVGIVSFHPRKKEEEEREGGRTTYDIKQGMEINELMQPNDTEIPHNLAAPTILSLIALSPVSKLNTAPAPDANRSCTSFPGCPTRPG